MSAWWLVVAVPAVMLLWAASAGIVERFMGDAPFLKTLGPFGVLVVGFLYGCLALLAAVEWVYTKAAYHRFRRAPTTESEPSLRERVADEIDRAVDAELDNTGWSKTFGRRKRALEVADRILNLAGVYFMAAPAKGEGA